MKTIQKKSEPQELTDWKLAKSRKWNDLKNPLKTIVKRALRREQGYICCYCERRLTKDDSHIEHFKPRNDALVDDLDYSNLLCSCQRLIAKGAPRHCGHAKDQCDYNLLVSPFDLSCEERFLFTSDGQILAASKSDTAAQKTIDELNLDIPKLRALRATVINLFEDSELSVEELEAMVKDYLALSTSGEFGEFWTTIKSLFGELAA